MSTPTINLMVAASETGQVLSVLLPYSDNTTRQLVVAIRMSDNGKFDLDVDEGIAEEPTL